MPVRVSVVAKKICTVKEFTATGLSKSPVGKGSVFFLVCTARTCPEMSRKHSITENEKLLSDNAAALLDVV